MKRFFCAAILIAAMLLSIPLGARAADLLVPVGRIIGLQLQDDTVTVAAFDDALGTCAKNAGLCIGDEILSINGAAIDCAEDVRSALDACRGAVSLTVRRSGKTKELRMTPAQTEDGPRLGVYLRQGIAGIGTVTFFDPDTHRFGTLGHGVSDAKGILLHMRRGNAYEAKILSVQRGICGTPGQLKGSTDSPQVIGTLLKNTPQGVFGTTTQNWAGNPIPTADWEELKTGPATIRSTVCGDGPREYSVEILKIYPKDRSDCRNFLLKVTDPDLLAITGGIVQGMSGSPIIQDGKLVGAVTHVLVNDPTRGYGIFIENMLDAAA